MRSIPVLQYVIGDDAIEFTYKYTTTVGGIDFRVYATPKGSLMRVRADVIDDGIEVLTKADLPHIDKKLAEMKLNKKAKRAKKRK